MFPNNSLKSISPDVRVMQAFPNIILGGKPQQIVEDKEGKHPRSRFTSHYGFFITAAPPKLSKIRFWAEGWESEARLQTRPLPRRMLPSPRCKFVLPQPAIGDAEACQNPLTGLL